MLAGTVRPIRDLILESWARGERPPHERIAAEMEAMKARDAEIVAMRRRRFEDGAAAAAASEPSADSDRPGTDNDHEREDAAR